MVTTQKYLSADDVLSGSNILLPARLDSIDFEYKGVLVHAYGLLHGLTGATNKQYLAIINETVAEAPGLKLVEKGLSTVYKGLDGELDDWLQVPLWDAFRLSLSLTKTPWHLLRLVKTVVRELTTKSDRFSAPGNNNRKLANIGGSMAFHAISPLERRALAGFAPTPDYLQLNSLRRSGKIRQPGPVFPDPDWYWLTHIEPYANLPLRSVHMLEFAVELTKLQGLDEVSIFVGETHNTDMAWVAQHQNTLSPELLSEITQIQYKARVHASAVQRKAFVQQKLYYFAALTAGLAVPVGVYVGAVVQLVKAVWHYLI